MLTHSELKDCGKPQREKCSVIAWETKVALFCVERNMAERSRKAAVTLSGTDESVLRV